MIRVLFVCMGNICRSPTAEGAFRELLRREGLDRAVWVDSAGTHAYHEGEAPDPRAIRAARRRGIELERIRARRVSAEDFEIFDYLLVMDEDNQGAMEALCPDVRYLERVGYFMNFAGESASHVVPDPYYGGPQGFERVLDLVETASIGLLTHLRTKHDLRG